MALSAAVLSGCREGGNLISPGSSTSTIKAGPHEADTDQVSHFLNRLSFGPRPGDYDRISRLGATQEEACTAYLEEQLRPDLIEDTQCDQAIRRLTTLNLRKRSLFEYKEKVLHEELVKGTILRAVHSKRQLHEVMVEFWSDHFNIDPSKGDSKWMKTWDDREVIRAHALGRRVEERGGSPITSTLELLGLSEDRDRTALGKSLKFSNLLKASALSPAMLWYLDGRQNRVGKGGDKPNENYARELLELHTLGVDGGYTQKDVMEVARCLTGWFVHGSNKAFKMGEVTFNKRLHDDGEKWLMGERIPAGLGSGDLDRVLDIVGTHPSTAKHLATKLCRKFIKDSPSSSTIDEVAQVFLSTGGDIAETLRSVFMTTEFTESADRKFKRPFRYVVSAIRATSAFSDGDRGIYDYLLRMGHAPFNYPTPDGYPEEAGPWMGSLMWRWNFAFDLAENRIKGTRVDLPALVSLAGGNERLVSMILGRTVKAEEMQTFLSSGSGLAAALASPGFQYH